jgi:hypothetical protein
MVIQFSDLKARKHLLEKGYVYTFRTKQRKRVGKDWASSGRGKPKVADVDIKLVKVLEGVLWRPLKDYVEDSGFKAVAEWVTAIVNVNPSISCSRGFLYRVEVIKS